MSRKWFVIVALGAVLLFLGCVWRPLIVPVILEDIENKAGEEMDSYEDMPIMEGGLGLMVLLQKVEEEGVDNFDYLDVTSDYFDLGWRDVYITSKGLFEKVTDKLIIGTTEGMVDDGGEGETFPSFGVEKKDYIIWDDWLNDTVTASYMGEKEIGGMNAYCYSVVVEDDGFDLLARSSEFGLEEDFESIDFIEGVEFFFDEKTNYYLEPKTSIPLDISMAINFSFIFPDMRALQPYDTVHVGTTESAIWVQDDALQGKYDMIEVIVEEYSRIDVLLENDNIALADEWSIYYYKDSGEPLPDEDQGEHRLSAVNRATFNYVTGFGNNQNRNGYYIFPVGNVKKIDYPMWDIIAGEASTAVYVGEESSNGSLINVYEMYTNDAELEGGNVFIPSTQHPGTKYIYNGIQRWQVDSVSGVMLDYYVNGTVSVVSTDPFHTINDNSTTVVFFLNESFKDTLSTVSTLYKTILLPLLNQKIDAVAIDLHYTNEMIQKMIETSCQLGSILGILRIWIPISLIGSGIIMVAVPLALSKKRRKETNVVTLI